MVIQPAHIIHNIICVLIKVSYSVSETISTHGESSFNADSLHQIYSDMAFQVLCSFGPTKHFISNVLWHLHAWQCRRSAFLGLGMEQTLNGTCTLFLCCWINLSYGNIIHYLCSPFITDFWKYNWAYFHKFVNCTYIFHSIKAKVCARWLLLDQVWLHLSLGSAAGLAC